MLDRGSFFEMGRYFGRPLITGLARLDGIPVGVMANDPKHAAGSIDADAGEKMQRFVDLCDTFHLPVVNFVDNPGFLVGTEAEKRGTIRKGVRALAAVFQATVPWCSIIVRKAYGVAGAGHSNHTRSSPRYAWPSGEWGSLPIEGGVEAAYKRVIAASDDPDAKRRELEANLEIAARSDPHRRVVRGRGADRSARDAPATRRVGAARLRDRGGEPPRAEDPRDAPLRGGRGQPRCD